MDCPFTQRLLKEIGSWWSQDIPVGLIESLLRAKLEVFMSIVYTFCCMIWKMRNRVVHVGDKFSLQRSFSQLQGLSLFWLFHRRFCKSKVTWLSWYCFPHSTPPSFPTTCSFRMQMTMKLKAWNPKSSLFEKITKVDDALQLFDKMTQRQPLPSVAKFNHLLAAVTKTKHYSCSIHLFKQMAAIGVPVDVYTTTIVIKCCCQMSCTSQGFAIVAYGFKRGVVPDVITFSTLLNGLILEDRVHEAERLFKKLIKEKLCEPNVVIYNTMIKGICKFGNNDIPIALLGLMDQRGCKPDVVTYSTIIDSLCKDEMVDDALKLFNEMTLHKGILPDVVTYNSLIRGLCNSGRWDDASKMLREMENERISPDVITYNLLVDALCKEGNVEVAEAIMSIMVKRGKVPNLVTYNSLIDGYCLQGELKKARTIFDSMRIGGLVPDIVTCNSLLNGYCKKSRIDEALRLFNEITENGMAPDVVTYGTMLQGLFRVGKCEDALQLFDEMRALNHISPDSLTYGIVLEGLCNNHQVDKALSLFRLMGENKLNLDIVLYNILIDGASKCGKPDIANDLFKEVSVKGLHPDVRTYNVMIGCFCREGLMREAERLFLQMEERGCPPCRVSYNVLLKGLLTNGQYDTIKMLLEEMERHGFSVEASTLSLLLDHISKRSLDGGLLKLIGKLVPKEGIEQASKLKCKRRSSIQAMELHQRESYIDFGLKSWYFLTKMMMKMKTTGNGNCIGSRLPSTSARGHAVFNAPYLLYAARDFYHININNVYELKCIKNMYTFYKLYHWNHFVNTFNMSSILASRILSSQTILSPFHSNLASTIREYSPFEKITNVDDALQLFDQLFESFLPSVVKFSECCKLLPK
ncbi:hypothetical protein OSB04_011368 [Centaurea solstitialis]|uniref:Pentatricopeptide repeat-containing protein n=1 Tax=Centaurea solstitialis TaxID=347529 RepID=A0AA38T9A8_9ASTR|nr:hypothetical protein OSB04_011368 [Centaurea solstitialis]